MRNSVKISAKPIWFSRWSRYAYAAAVSIGKVVHIGRVKVDICRMALLKSGALGSDVLVRQYLQASESSSGPEADELAESILQQLMRELALPVLCAASAEGASCYFSEIYLMKECKVHSLSQFRLGCGLSFFYKPNNLIDR